MLVIRRGKDNDSLPLTCLPWPCGSGEEHEIPQSSGRTHGYFQAKRSQEQPLYMTANNKLL